MVNDQEEHNVKIWNFYQIVSRLIADYSGSSLSFVLRKDISLNMSSLLVISGKTRRWGKLTYHP